MKLAVWEMEISYACPPATAIKTIFNLKNGGSGRAGKIEIRK